MHTNTPLTLQQIARAQCWFAILECQKLGLPHSNIEYRLINLGV